MVKGQETVVSDTQKKHESPVILIGKCSFSFQLDRFRDLPLDKAQSMTAILGVGPVRLALREL